MGHPGHKCNEIGKAPPENFWARGGIEPESGHRFNQQPLTIALPQRRMRTQVLCHEVDESARFGRRHLTLLVDHMDRHRRRFVGLEHRAQTSRCNKIGDLRCLVPIRSLCAVSSDTARSGCANCWRWPPPTSYFATKSVCWKPPAAFQSAFPGCGHAPIAECGALQPRRHPPREVTRLVADFLRETGGIR